VITELLFPRHSQYRELPNKANNIFSRGLIYSSEQD